MINPILAVEALKVFFALPGDRTVKAVDNVSFTIGRREIFGLVGESGSGKTTIALSILRLLPAHMVLVDGRIIVGEMDVMALSEVDLRKIRGRRVAMIFQNAQQALNPVASIGRQVAGIVRLHTGLDRERARQEAIRLLESVGFCDAKARFEDFPHQLSGGMCQRVMIAMALACKPDLLIADEPTSSLDVTVQAQILKLLLDIRDEFGMSILLISHDLGVIAETCDRVAVMRAGQLVEIGDVFDIFTRPQHDYTKLLLDSVPVPDPTKRAVREATS